MHAELDRRGDGLLDLVAGRLAPVHAAVVRGVDAERVDVGGDVSAHRVRGVHLYVAPLPDELGRGVAAPSHARQRQRVAGRHDVALDVALDLGDAGGVCNGNRLVAEEVYFDQVIHNYTVIY